MRLIDLPLSELIIAYPDVAFVLQSHRIDVREHNTNVMQLLKNNGLRNANFLGELKNALMTSVCAHYKNKGTDNLTHEIIKRFHKPHKAQMYRLISDARYIEKKYVEHNSCPQGLYVLLIEFLDDLANHMEQEELFLFPALNSTGDVNMFSQLALAHHSHDRHINMMDKLESITHNFTPPTNASMEWQTLYENLLEFILQLNMHIAIENQFLLSN